jgi:hypothetical protein
MLVDGTCTIYEHRPRACRTYDCRVFAATAIDVDEDGTKVDIGRRARRWRFDFTSEADCSARDAVRAAVAVVAERDVSATERAVLAIRLAGDQT